MTELATTQTQLVVTSNLPADQHPALVYLASLAPGSRRTMREALTKIAALDGADIGTLNWSAMRYQHVAAIQARLLSMYSKATARKMMAALRGVLKEAWRLGQMTAEDYQRATDIKSIQVDPVAQAEKGRHITSGEFKALLAVCQDGTTKGARDAAIIIIGYSAGLRRSEIVGLDVEDYNSTECRLTIRHGKGDKSRVVYINRSACGALGDWLHVSGITTGSLFHAVDKHGNILPRRIDQQTIYDVLIARGDAAGIKRFSPHDLRRTFAGDMLDAGTDLATVQDMMGHSNPKTTARYDRRGSRVKKAAADKLHIPFKRQFRD